MIIMSHILLLSCCVMFASYAAVGASSSGSGRSRYNAIFNFGDSMSDTGNLCPDGRPLNSGVVTDIFAKLPYGITYFGKPTCRCCDGRVIVDFLAQALGLPLLPPSKAHGKDFRRGANMAISGGTVLEYSVTQFIGNNVSINGSLSAQMDNFRQLLTSICETRESCKGYLAKSLFVFQLGENDYTFQLMIGSTIDEAMKSIPNVVRGLTSGVEELIALGAANIVVSNVAPIGCFPLCLSTLESSNKSDYDGYGCLRTYNAVYDKHNSFLQASISSLQKKHRHTRIMYADLGGHFNKMLQSSAKKIGFKSALSSCCGEDDAPYKFSLFALCGMNGTSVCSDPSSRLIWDGMHLSDAANKQIADGWLYGPYCDPPILY